MCFVTQAHFLYNLYYLTTFRSFIPKSYTIFWFSNWQEYCVKTESMHWDKYDEIVVKKEKCGSRLSRTTDFQHNRLKIIYWRWTSEMFVFEKRHGFHNCILPWWLILFWAVAIRGLLLGLAWVNTGLRNVMYHPTL